MSVKDPSSFRLVATLSAAGLISGLVLAGVYMGTRARIQQNQAEALERAIFSVVPGAASFVAMAEGTGTLTPKEGDASGGKPGELVYAVKDKQDNEIGYAIPADGAGFMDSVTLLYGYDPARRAVVGMEVLESRETPGLGDKIITDDHFRANFKELLVEPTILAVKKGDKTQANQVDTITGATISSKAVIKIINRSVERWRELVNRADDSGGATK